MTEAPDFATFIEVMSLSSPTQQVVPLKVLHIFASNSWGGAEIHALELADWVRSSAGSASGLHCETALWCPKDSPLERAAREKGITVFTDPLPFRSFWPRPFLFLKVLKRYRPHLLHFHWPAGLRLALGLKGFFDESTRPRVLLQTHMWISKPKRGLFHRLAFRLCDAVTAAGPRGIESIEKNFLIPNQKLFQVPYTIEPSPLHTDQSLRKQLRIETRLKLGLSDEDFLIGYFGRIDTQKGVLELIRALEPHFKAQSQLHLLLVGDPTRNESEAQIYNAEVNQAIEQSFGRLKITRLPHQKSFYPYLSACDLMAMPSHHECYSILLLHAFSLGVPVLSTRAGGTPDLIAEPLRGWLCDSKSIDSLSAAIGEILKLRFSQTVQAGASAKSELDMRAARAHEYFLRVHQKPVVLERWNTLYAKLIEQRPNLPSNQNKPTRSHSTLIAFFALCLGLLKSFNLFLHICLLTSIVQVSTMVRASGLDVQLKDLTGSYYNDPTHSKRCKKLTRSALKQMKGRYTHCHAGAEGDKYLVCPLDRLKKRSLLVFQTQALCEQHKAASH